MMCCNRAWGLHRPSGGCSQSRISTHVKLRRASRCARRAMMGSYLDKPRSGARCEITGLRSQTSETRRAANAQKTPRIYQGMNGSKDSVLSQIKQQQRLMKNEDSPVMVLCVVVACGQLCCVRSRLVPPVYTCQLDAQLAGRLELIYHVAIAGL